MFDFDHVEIRTKPTDSNHHLLGINDKTFPFLLLALVLVILLLLFLIISVAEINVRISTLGALTFLIIAVAIKLPAGSPLIER
ncbi:MAG: hypothetical protein ACSLEM_04585 [Candidatus Malihini olakiniferum]